MNIVKIDGVVYGIETSGGSKVYNVKLENDFIVDCVDWTRNTNFVKGDPIHVEGELATYDQGGGLVKATTIEGR